MTYNKKLSIILLILVAGAYAIMSVAARYMNEGLAPFSQSFIRVALGSVIATILFRKDVSLKTFLHLSLRDWVILLVMGVFGYGIFLYFITQGAIQAKLLNVTVLYSTIIFFSYGFALLFLKQKFDVRVLVLIFISFIGIIFIATKSFTPSFSSFGIGELYILGAAACGASYMVGRKMLSKSLNNSELAVSTMAIAACVTLVGIVAKGEVIHMSAFSNIHVVIGLGLGSVLNALVSKMEMFSLEHLNAVLASQIMLLENVFAIGFGYVLYREVVSFPEMCGVALVLGSIYVAHGIMD